MKSKTSKSNYKRLVFAFTCLAGLASQPIFAQSSGKPNDHTSAGSVTKPLQASSPAIKTVLLGYYPANYLMASPTASLRVQNQFMGMGDKLCVWIEGEYTLRPIAIGQAQGDKLQAQGDKLQTQSDNVSAPLNNQSDASLQGSKQSQTGITRALGFTAILTNDSTFNTTITAIEMQYYPAQKATALFIPIPTNAILFNAYKVKLVYNEKNIATINKLYLVPNYTLPEIVNNINQLKINNIDKLTGGQAPFQYYWMEYSNGHGKMISSGSVDELSKLPTIKTEDKDATYSLMIKDANYLVSNQYISTKASKSTIKNNLGIQVNIYPNPTTSELYVNFVKVLNFDKAINNELTYTITDLLGKELLKGTLNTTDLKTIAVQTLAQGTYILNITNSKDSGLLYQNKFVKL